MEQEIWSTDQPVLSDDLIQLQSSKEDAIKTRLTDVFVPGALDGSQLLLESQAFAMSVGSASVPLSPTLTVGTGVAIAPSGERILLPDQETYQSPVVTGTTVTSGNPFAPDGTPNGPLTTSSDGLGGYTLTPQNSGSVNIPLIQNTTNYIWIAYLKTIDPTTFTLQDLTNQRLFTKGQDGYKIEVTTGATPSGDFILLGQVVVTTTFTASDISTANRQVAKTKLVRVGITVDTASRPSIYADGTSTVLDDHINAIGSGSITPTNPHGLAPIDIGINNSEATLKYISSSGLVVPDATTTSSALFAQVTSSGVASENIVEFKALTSLEVVNVNGVFVTSSDIGVNVDFKFVDALNVPIAAGLYTLYVDNTTKTIKRSLPNQVISDSNDFRLCSISWNGTSLDISSFKDLRLFGTTAAPNFRFETLQGLLSGTAAVNRSISFFNAKLVGSVQGSSYTINGQTLIVTVDGGSPQTATFSGTNPIPIATIVSQINAQITGITAVAVYDNYVELLSTVSLTIGAGTSNSTLGFTNAETSSGKLFQMQFTGDATTIAGQLNFVVLDYGGLPNFTSTVSTVGGLNVSGQTLIVNINGGSPQTITFTGTNPLTQSTIVSQINAAASGFTAAPTGNFIILAATAANGTIILGSGTANSTLGFTPADNTLLTSATSTFGNRLQVSTITYVNPFVTNSTIKRVTETLT